MVLWWILATLSLYRLIFTQKFTHYAPSVFCPSKILYLEALSYIPLYTFIMMQITNILAESTFPMAS